MEKQSGITAISLAVILLVTVVLSTGCGCPLHSDILYGPKVTGDGKGGAIAVYADIKGDGADIYAQKIGPDGEAVWGEAGVLTTG